MSELTGDEFVQQINELNKEGQGVWEMALYETSKIPDMKVAAAQGDRHAMVTLAIFAEFGGSIKAREPGNYRVCFTCVEAEFVPGKPDTWPQAVVVISPDVPTPTQGLVEGVCAGCFFGNPTEQMQKMLSESVARIFGCRGRLLPERSQAGHA